MQGQRIRKYCQWDGCVLIQLDIKRGDDKTAMDNGGWPIHSLKVGAHHIQESSFDGDESMV